MTGFEGADDSMHDVCSELLILCVVKGIMRRTNRSGLARPEKIVTEESALEWQERTKGKKGGRSRRLDVLVFFGAFYIVLVRGRSYCQMSSIFNFCT